jgi:hypothetical protein
MFLGGVQLTAADIAVTWASQTSEQRRAVLGMNHVAALALLARLPGASSHMINVRAALDRLTQPGQPIMIRTPTSVMDVVRAWRAPGDLSSEPVLLDCGAVGALRVATICPDVASARKLARAANAQHHRTFPWHIYPAEIAQASLHSDSPGFTAMEAMARGD